MRRWVFVVPAHDSDHSRPAVCWSRLDKANLYKRWYTFGSRINEISLVKGTGSSHTDSVMQWNRSTVYVWTNCSTVSFHWLVQHIRKEFRKSRSNDWNSMFNLTLDEYVFICICVLLWSEAIWPRPKHCLTHKKSTVFFGRNEQNKVLSVCICVIAPANWRQFVTNTRIRSTKQVSEAFIFGESETVASFLTSSLLDLVIWNNT